MSRPGSGGSESPRRSWLEALVFAMQGLRYAVRTQPTLRALLLAGIVIGTLLFWLRLPPADTAMVILAMAIVLAAELFNTGAEAIADLLVERNEHRLAKLAKDVAAGAVLLTMVAAALVGILLLGPPLAAAVGVDRAATERIARIAAVLVAVGGTLGLLSLMRGRINGRNPLTAGRRPRFKPGLPSDDRPFDSAQGRRPTTDDR